MNGHMMKILSLVCLMLFTFTAPSFAQAFRQVPTRLQPTSKPILAGPLSIPAAHKVSEGDSTLRYFDFAQNAFRFPLGASHNSRATGMFFTAPFTGQVDQVNFLLMDDAQQPGITGTGTLRLKMVPSEEILTPETPGIDSLDLDFANLAAASPGVALPLTNHVDLREGHFTVVEGREYFFQFSLVGASADAALGFVFDGGSADTTDTRYFPARSFVYAEVEGEEGYFPFLGLCEDCLFPNVVMELVLSEASLAQFIHNVPGAGQFDLYLDGRRVADDLGFRETTPVLPVSVGERLLEVVAGGEADNSSPLFTKLQDVAEGQRLVAMMYAAPGGGIDFGFGEIAAEASGAQINLMVGHGGANVGTIDVRVLDETPEHNVVETLAQGLPLGTIVGAGALDPGVYNVEVVDADNAMQLDVYRLDLTSFEVVGTTVILLTSGILGGNPPFSLIAMQADGTVLTPSVNTATEATGQPEQFVLHQNYPNPFNPQTTIRYTVPQASPIRLEVFDMLGRLVAVLVDEQKAAGSYEVRFDAQGLPSGTYLYQMTSDGFTHTRKLILLK